MLSSVVSDTFGKASSAILKYVLDHPDEKNVDFSKFMTRGLHATAEDLSKAMNGSFSPEQANKTKIAFQHFDYINLCLENLDSAISLLAKKYQPQITLLSSIPGVTEHSATRIIAEIGNDMSVFLDSKHLCSWAGLTPQNNESAGKKKSVHISHAGQYLKPLLIQCALNAAKSKDCPYFAFKYQALSRRRGKKRAIIAIARMILTSIYHMLSGNVPFDTDLYNRYYHEANSKLNNLSVKKIVSFLSEKGYAVINADTGQVLSNTG
jgi:hypothetical protein